MKKKLFFIFALSLLFIPIAVFAADPTASLEGTGSGLVPQCEGAFCRACDLAELANNVINFGVAFSVVVATLMFAYAGILYVTAAGKGAEQVKKAHGIFVNVFVGLVIVLISWLLIDIGFSVLTGQGLSVWSHIDCIANPITKAFPDAPADTGGAGSWGSTSGDVVAGGAGAGVLSSTASVGGAYPTNAAAVRVLEGAGVCGGSVPCVKDGQSLAGLRVQTVDQLVELHKGCGCQFTVTSGVRLDGTPHQTGFKADVRLNDTLDKYIQSTFSPLYGGKMVAWGNQRAYVYTDRCGNLYAREYGAQPHWDIGTQPGKLCLF